VHTETASQEQIRDYRIEGGLNAYIQQLQTGVTQRRLWATTHLLSLDPWRFIANFIRAILRLSVMDYTDFSIYLSNRQ